MHKIIIAGLSVLTGLSSISSGAGVTSIALPRAIYWDVAHSYLPTGFASRRDYFAAVGVSEVHIWLNDNEWDADHGSRCQPFSYTDSHGAVRWTRQSLTTFVRELKDAGVTPVFTLSPQVQSLEYIASLSGPDGPLTIARQEGVKAIELDLEGNWRADRLIRTCGSGTIDQINRALVDAIRGPGPGAERHPLTLIASTTAWKLRVNRALVEAADVIAPQLYEARYGYTADAAKAELRSLWLPFNKPLVASLNLGCRGEDMNSKCSRAIFERSLRAVATLAKCGPQGARITNYVLWSQSTVARLSSFGKAWLTDTRNQPIETSCP